MLESVTVFAETLRRFRKALPWNRPKPPVVLCADDDKSVRRLCSAALVRAGFDVEQVANGSEALARLRTRRYDAVLLDFVMPGLHGATVLSVLRRDHPEVLSRIIVISAAPDAALTDAYGLVGAVLRKPIKLDALVDVVRGCCAPAQQVS
ncbi:MAG TPA: response regulator [Thermoanaerobaculia bacterium]|nr:response regulator [Thermoanaerobaculia bacterium]